VVLIQGKEERYDDGGGMQGVKLHVKARRGYALGAKC
jgi:hypothetical protein